MPTAAPKHLRPSRPTYDDTRLSASERGYDHSWRKTRAAVLAQEPLCRECMKRGVVAAANEVDHIIAKRRGGLDVAENLQPLCKSCHSRKTMSETNGDVYAAYFMVGDEQTHMGV